ncbi:energy transducer TonB [Salinimicrobium xinjiangense]|uniref:energy transducer TonB n=1 Tax=Salinimicrobium xinjiangense TaxID=438596 RepID=UPI00040F6A49|nr:hypothetical protein [Salinimicrobium xinjiangense]
MKYLLPFLFIFFLTSQVLSQQQEDTSVAFVHILKAEKYPFSANCVERSPACAATEIQNYIFRDIHRIGPLSELQSGKIEIPVRVIIDTEGKVSWASVKELPADSAELLADLLKKMPAFTPGEHEGKKANIIVDLRLPLYFSESDDLDTEVVSFEDVATKPAWKNCRKAGDPSCTTIAINDWMNRSVRTSVIKEPGSYKLTATFVIGTDGKTGRIVVFGGGDEFATEVIHQLKKMPRFEPGSEAGKPVAVNYTLPMSLKKR